MIMLFQHMEVRVFNKVDREPSNPGKHLLETLQKVVKYVQS